MKVLLITPYFPSFDVQQDNLRTKFLYYYAAEWVKQGHEILVLHCPFRYPRLFTPAVDLLENRIGFKRMQLSRFKQNFHALGHAIYEHEGIKIIRTPITKLIPHHDFLPWDLAFHRKQVLRKYKESGFKPDIVISDFVTPSAYIAEDIRIVSGISFYQVMHQSDFDYLKRGSSLCRLIRKSSGILFRSYSHIQRFKHDCFVPAYEDCVFTGVPNDTQLGDPRTIVKKILFVGWLRMAKNIHTIIEAIASSNGSAYFELEIIGEGPYEESLKALISQLGLQKQVIFSGRQPREKVFEKMRSADCLIMISKETYGMVYIEAISQGCIVVAAKNQGVDGIIVNGKNGFLVECGNVKELTELLNQFMIMDKEEVMRISAHGIKTAKQMTDGQLAKDLLERLSNQEQCRK